MEVSNNDTGLKPEDGFSLKHGTFITSLNTEKNGQGSLSSLNEQRFGDNNGISRLVPNTSTKVIENLYLQIDQLTNNNFNLTNQNQELLKQMNLLNEQISKLNRNNNMSRNEINSKDLKIKKLEKQITGHEFQLEKFEKDYEFLRNEFLAKAQTYHTENSTLETQLLELKNSLKDLTNGDKLNKAMKEYDLKFNHMDSSFRDFKFQLIQQMDDLKVENNINIDKLSTTYDNANNLLGEFDNENEKKRVFLKEKKPKLDRDIKKVNEKQRFLEETLSKLERGTSATISDRNTRQSNRSKRESVYDNNQSEFKSHNSSRNRIASPLLNNRRNSKFYGGQLEQSINDAKNHGNSPKLGGNNFSNKRQSFLFDDQAKTAQGLGIHSTRGAHLNSDQVGNTKNGSFLPGLKRNGSLRR
ncbi:hypothetical protein QEN19_003905 [Hanseniaspora menglaensis]